MKNVVVKYFDSSMYSYKTSNCEWMKKFSLCNSTYHTNKNWRTKLIRYPVSEDNHVGRMMYYIQWIILR